MSELSKALICFNPMTGKRDGKYCVWEGGGKCMDCQAGESIEQLEKDKAELVEVANKIAAYCVNSTSTFTECCICHATCSLQEKIVHRDSCAILRIAKHQGATEQ